MPRPARAQHTAAVVYPNRYHVGMSNLGLHRLLELVHAQPSWQGVRLFLPPGIGPGRPAPAGDVRTFDLDLPVRDVDVLLVTLSYEEDYANLVALLRAAGIHAQASRRQVEDPLVVIGGFAPSLNPEPLASVADAFLLGAAELVLPPFLERLATEGADRDGLATAVADLSGCLVPGSEPPQRPLYVPYVEPSWLEDGGEGALAMTESRLPLARTRILTPHTEFADRYLVAMGEGCPHGCRFCAAGYARRPPLAWAPAALEDAVDEGLAAGGRIGLVGAAVTDHPHLPALAARVTAAGGDLSTSSLGIRAILARDPGSVGRTATLAPEAATEAQRRAVNKPLSDEDVLTAVMRCVDRGAVRVRLYLLVGLPGEVDADADAIVDLAAACRERVLARSRHPVELVLSVNPFVPKAGTPMQWGPLARPAVVRQRLDRIRRGVRILGGVRLQTGGARLALRQAILSLGGRDVVEVMELVPGVAGWWQRLQRWHDDRGAFLFEPRDRDASLPWAYLERGITREHLWREWQRAGRGRTTPACDVLRCTACGAC